VFIQIERRHWSRENPQLNHHHAHQHEIENVPVPHLGIDEVINRVGVGEKPHHDLKTEDEAKDILDEREDLERVKRNVQTAFLVHLQVHPDPNRVQQDDHQNQLFEEVRLRQASARRVLPFQRIGVLAFAHLEHALERGLACIRRLTRDRRMRRNPCCAFTHHTHLDV
jgi:hypothetical protein